jgi:hypothetical protein
MKVSAALRREIRRVRRDEGVTMYAIARDAGLNYAIVYEFVKGRRSLKLGSVDAIVEVLGGRLVFNARES